MSKHNRSKKTVLMLAAAGLLGSAALSQAAEPLVQLDFNHDTITNVGSFELTGLGFSDAQGDAPVFVDTGINGMKAIKLDGTNYINTATETQALGISGAASKTASALVRPSATGNYAIWSIGNCENLQDFTVKTYGDKELRGQQWGSDFSTSVPYSIKDNWGLVTQTYDGKTVRIYYNGQLTGSNNMTLNTGTAGTIKAGYWYDLANSFRGDMADFRIYNESLTAKQVRRAAYDLGGGLFTFKENIANGFGVGTDDGWHAGCGNTMFYTEAYSDINVIRAGSGSANQNSASDTEGTVLDTYNGILWGQPFTVVDDTKEITFKMAGGTFEAPDAAAADNGTNISYLRDKAGMVLYDITDGKFLLDTYRCSSTNNDKTSELKTISLNGLKGHEVALALVDFAVGSWGMTAVGDINIPLGTGTFNKEASLTYTTKAYDFDTAGDWEGWFEVDANGNRLDSVTNFRFGAPGDCDYYIGSNFITSNSPNGGWDAAVGTLRSETFTIDGDIIEFMINGGAGGDYGFELWVLQDGAEDFERVREAHRSSNNNDFEYSFWDVSDLEGLDAFLQLRDNQNANWGWVGIDNLQMVDFGQVPEPSTWALLLLGTAGLWVVRRRKN